MGDVPMPRNWGASQQFGLGEAPGGELGAESLEEEIHQFHPLAPEEDVRRLQTGADAVKPRATVIYFLVPLNMQKGGLSMGNGFDIFGGLLWSPYGTRLYS
ncbi:hypothetical protein CEXT_694571 [Caerostris extrusa]|uniref:Uncharacterized protein n=1 Tax=Caerostris extrusa TaxID=172846 RepID=A0AAV4TV44_CAEEX|nr:hypothetical protein CEXT_694571 [Caerostris extrusa]